MPLGTENETLIVRYLLDDLPAEERRRLERRYFLDDQLFESVRSVEEQLIRDFLRGELPAERGERFETRYLQSPQLSEKVESARLLMQLADALRREGRPISGPSFLERLREFFRWRGVVPGFATAGLVAVAILVIVWFGLDNRQLRTELARSEFERSSLAARLQTEAATPKDAKRESGLAGAVREYAKGLPAAPLAFVLSSGVTRGEGVGRQRISIPVQGVDRVRLSLDFTPFERYAAYRVIVSSVDGGDVSSQDLPGTNPTNSRNKLGIDLPATSLPEGDYIAVVKGGGGASGYEDVESYYFHVVRGSKPR
jgi:anti-sigma factor RsiW